MGARCFVLTKSAPHWEGQVCKTQKGKGVTYVGVENFGIVNVVIDHSDVDATFTG